MVSNMPGLGEPQNTKYEEDNWNCVLDLSLGAIYFTVFFLLSILVIRLNNNKFNRQSKILLLIMLICHTMQVSIIALPVSKDPRCKTSPLTIALLSQL